MQKAKEALARYLPAAAQAWIDGLSACRCFWNHKKERWENSDFPDHNLRAECAEKIWHNVVGKPIDRSMEVSGSYKELSQLIDELQASPEAKRLLGAGFFDSLLSGQSKAEGKDQEKPHERLTVLPSEQETG